MGVAGGMCRSMGMGKVMAATLCAGDAGGRVMVMSMVMAAKMGIAMVMASETWCGYDELRMHISRGRLRNHL